MQNIKVTLSVNQRKDIERKGVESISLKPEALTGHHVVAVDSENYRKYRDAVAYNFRRQSGVKKDGTKYKDASPKGVRLIVHKWVNQEGGNPLLAAAGAAAAAEGGRRAAGKVASWFGLGLNPLPSLDEVVHVVGLINDFLHAQEGEGGRLQGSLASEEYKGRGFSLTPSGFSYTRGTPVPPTQLPIKIPEGIVPKRTKKRK